MHDGYIADQMDDALNDTKSEIVQLIMGVKLSRDRDIYSSNGTSKRSM